MSTEASKNVTGRQEYSPSGDVYASVNPGTTRGYTGHDYDAVSGFYFEPLRYYAPGLGRWIIRDPLGMISGPNMHAYVGGNPVMRVDPSGCGYWDCFGDFVDIYLAHGGNQITNNLVSEGAGDALGHVSDAVGDYGTIMAAGEEFIKISAPQTTPGDHLSADNDDPMTNPVSPKERGRAFCAGLAIGAKFIMDTMSNLMPGGDQFKWGMAIGGYSPGSMLQMGCGGC